MDDWISRPVCASGTRPEREIWPDSDHREFAGGGDPRDVGRIAASLASGVVWTTRSDVW